MHRFRIFFLFLIFWGTGVWAEASKLFLDLSVRIEGDKVTSNLVFQDLTGSADAVQVVDYSSLDIEDNSISFSDSYLDLLKERRENYIENEKMFKRFDPSSSFASEIEKLDKEILKEEERLQNQVKAEDCYPRLKLSFSEEYSFSHKKNYIDTLAHFYPVPGCEITSMYQLNAENIKNDNEKIKLFSSIIKSYFPLLEKIPETNPPVLIDSKNIVAQKINYRNSTGLISLAVRDDYSLVIRNGYHLAEFSVGWEETKSYDDIFSKIKTTNPWTITCAGGKNVLFANLNSPSVYSADGKSKLKIDSQWNFSHDGYFLYFDNAGNPYFTDISSEKMYIPQSDGKQPVRYPQNQIPYVTKYYATPGNNGTFYFQTFNTVFVLDRNSQITKIIQLKNPGNSRSQIVKILPDDTIIAINQAENFMRKYTPEGNEIWTKKFTGGASQLKFLEAKKDIFYLTNTLTNEIFRFAEYDAKLPPILASLKTNNSSERLTLSQQAQNYLSLADTYFENLNFTSAKEQYEKYLMISPNDYDANEKYIACDNILNKKAAEISYNKALSLLDEYGEETARSDYQEAIKILEKLRKRTPWDSEVFEMYNELKQSFNPSEVLNSEEIPAVSIERIELTSLFPALINVYANQENGSIVIKNNSDSTISNIRISSYIRRYMDFAAESEKTEILEQGQECTIKIKTPVNKNTLSLSEPVNVQMQFTVKWEEKGKSKSLTITRPVTIYSKSAMTWNDTAMLSCFVQPNDSTVKAFTFKALESKPQNMITKKLTEAIQISNAIASIPLNYVSDPAAPCEQLLDNEYAIDTVRFPDETLELKGGDCDDMTTLFCSALESTGISTAFITTPGHIFAAFNTEISNSIFWNNLNPDFKVIISEDNKVWIPVETTSLSKGFIYAWKKASQEITKNEYEIVHLDEAWKTYKSVSLSAAKKDVPFDFEKLDSFNKITSSSLIKEIDSALAKTSTENLSEQELNAIAKLYYFRGNSEVALEILYKAISLNSQYMPAYANLTRIYNKSGSKNKEIQNFVTNSIIIVEEKIKNNTPEQSRAANSDEEIWEE